MKYLLEIDSPDALLLAQELAGWTVRAALRHQKQAALFGRGSPQAIAMGQEIKAAERVLVAFKHAVAMAAPERSTGTAITSLQSGDEMPLVYGRPHPVAPPGSRRTRGTR